MLFNCHQLYYVGVQSKDNYLYCIVYQPYSPSNILCILFSIEYMIYSIIQIAYLIDYIIQMVSLILYTKQKNSL